jgi:hypothetical protein
LRERPLTVNTRFAGDFEFFYALTANRARPHSLGLGLVPAPGNANDETLIKFDDVQHIGIDLERNRITSRIESLTCVYLVTPAAMHSIYGRLLREGEFDEIIVRIVENIDDRIAAGIDPDVWFDLATKLEMAGEWHRSFRYYSIAANRLEGTQDGDYAVNCVKRLKEKIASFAAAPAADGAVT